MYIWLICIYMTSEDSMKWHRRNIQKYFLYLAHMFSVVFKSRDSQTTHSLHRSDSRWQISLHARVVQSRPWRLLFAPRVTICRYFMKYRICQSKLFRTPSPPIWITPDDTAIFKFSLPNKSRQIENHVDRVWRLYITDNVNNVKILIWIR